MKEQKPRKHCRLSPCPSYDVERIESWLTDMAKDGLHLDSVKIFDCFVFTEGAPQTVRYRLEPKPRKDGQDSERPQEDIVLLCREYGWEFVAPYGPFYIYRAARPDAREMNTDISLQAEAMKAVKRRFTLELVPQLLTTGFAAYVLFREPFRCLISFGAAITFGFMFVTIGVLVLEVVRAVHIHSLQSRLKRNIPLDHNKPWKKGALAGRAGKLLAVLFDVFLLILLLSRCGAAVVNDGTPLTEFSTDPPFVTIGDLRPEGEYASVDFFDYNRFQQWSTFFSPENIEWMEHGEVRTPGEETLSGSLIVYYHETASPFIAKGLAEEYMREDRKYGGLTVLALPELGIDEAIAYSNDLCPTVILRQGNVLVKADVLIDNRRSESLYPLWAELMAQRLK